ncbi:MAG: serine hydrolase domain-containing protein [Bacteroidota bacterium]
MKIIRKVFTFILPFIFTVYTVSQAQVKSSPTEVFTKELTELQTYFSIPGMSALIESNGEIVYEKYLGYADLATQRKVGMQTTFPVASLTKVFSATLVMQLVEQNKLSLDTPVNQFLPNTTLDNAIQVKHLLSHTSQGEIGEQFYYSVRFGLLTSIIEKAAGKPFKALMQQKIFIPAGLQHTFLLEDSTQLAQKNVDLASPYVLEEDIRSGFVDYGYSTSAGIVSTARDLLRFTQALDANELMTEASKVRMFSAFQPALPYGYGIFTQKVEEIEIVWAYGQYDCYSSLLLKVPSKNLTLVLLANNNLMSDPARLIMGDVTSSLFALSFLKNFVFDLPTMPLLEAPNAAYTDNNFAESEFYRKKILAQALATSFMARFDVSKMQQSAQLLEKTFKQYPDYLSYANINLLHTLSFLKDVAFYRELGAFNQFDTQIEQIGEKLLEETPSNPYLHTYLGTYFDRKGDEATATFHYRSIVDAKNFSRNWYTKEAANWLKEHKK